MTARFTVAIDGPAAAGKGTISRAIATEFGFAHLDTGLLYRAVGKLALNIGGGVLDEIAAEEIARRLKPKDLERDDLRDNIAAQAASKVAVLPPVRQALREFQRRFATRIGGAVLDGRDIGTVICPDADVKLFITASETTRARRRFEELTDAGAETTLDAVLADLKSRDARDAERDESPMFAAADAVVIDTSDLSIAEAIKAAAAHISAKRAQR